MTIKELCAALIVGAVVSVFLIAATIAMFWTIEACSTLRVLGDVTMSGPRRKAISGRSSYIPS